MSLKDHARNLSQKLWHKAQPTVEKYRPQAEQLWARIEALAATTFALTDHSSLRLPRILFRVSMACLVLFFAWAGLFKIDQVVHAQGSVIASSRTQIVQAADGGVLVDMKVQEGDEVKAGEIIAVLEKERVLASFTESQGKVMALRMTVARLQAEITDKPLAFDDAIQKNYPTLYETQMNLYKQRTKAIDDQLAVLKDNVNLAQQELAMNQPLEKMGDISKADILRLKRTVNEARNQYASTKNKYLQDASAELNKAQEDLNSQEQTLADREQLLEHTDIIAPATGIVKSVKVTTLGGVVRQGDEILQILPTESDLVVEAKIKPADMANIKPGLLAKVKLDAYDYAIFGTMSGAVTYVSADTLQEDTKAGPMTYYRVKVAITEKDYKKSERVSDIEVRPGMTATVDIQTGKRSVLSYLLKPVTKTFTEAFGER
ncbi:MAG: Type secretion system rane fusion protein PrsE [Pseudomonadota bacterium]